MYILPPPGVIAAGGFVITFVWALRRGQLDDLDTPTWRMLQGEIPAQPPGESSAYPPREDEPGRT